MNVEKIFLPTNTILKGNSYNYLITKVLGQGTFGITYLASVKMAGALGTVDANIKVAIKEFFMRDINGRSDTTVTCGSKGGIYDDYKRKFTREAVNLSKLQHPNIIKVIESFEANNTVYYVMEYIGGGSLDDYITKNNGLKEDEAIGIVKQIGSALAFMHNNKMLHLDLKPSNIMRKDSGDVVLIDFGLSKQYDEKGEPESSTKVGAGTPGYAPLEQANYREGKGFPVTMDVYALGATMFKMLTGIRPPEASDILNDGFPLYEFQEHYISENLSACIAKAMAPTKKDRCQSVIEFLNAINNNKDTTIVDVEIAEKKSKTEKDIVDSGSGSGSLPIRTLWSSEKIGCITTLMGHKGYVRSVEFSQDGQHIVSAAFDNRAAIWNIHNGRCLFLNGHTHTVLSAVFSPNGRYVATGGVDKTVRLWDARDGSCLHVFKGFFSGHRDLVDSVTFTPDNNYIISASADETIRLWDLYSKNCKHKFCGHSSTVEYVSVSHSGEHIASSSIDRTIRLWDIKTGKCLSVFKGSDMVESVVFGPNDRHLIAAEGKTIRLWDIATGKCIRVFEGHDSFVHFAAISPDGKIIASASSDKTIRLWDIHTGKCIQILKGHHQTVNHVAFSPNGQYLASASCDRIVRIWGIVNDNLNKRQTPSTENKRDIILLNTNYKKLTLGKVVVDLPSSTEWSVKNLIDWPLGIIETPNASALTTEDARSMIGKLPWSYEERDLKDYYYWFFSWPPYTLQGIRLRNSRLVFSRSTNKLDLCSYLFETTGETAKTKILHIAELFIQELRSRYKESDGRLYTNYVLHKVFVRIGNKYDVYIIKDEDNKYHLNLDIHYSI